VAEIHNRQMVAEYDYHLEQIQFHKEAAEAIRISLEKVAGEEESITLDGKEEFTFAYVNRYQGDRFRKENPELAKEFTFEVTEEKIDWLKIKRMAPDLARRYQSRSFKRVS